MILDLESKNTSLHQKVAMVTPEITENCHYVQNDPHKCRIKLGKFDFDILCCFGVIKERLLGGRNPLPPPGEIGLNNKPLCQTVLNAFLTSR